MIYWRKIIWMMAKSLRLIDYEYSGNNDPCFELGNTCQEMQFNDNQINEVCSAYFGFLRHEKSRA